MRVYYVGILLGIRLSQSAGKVQIDPRTPVQHKHVIALRDKVLTERPEFIETADRGFEFIIVERPDKVADNALGSPYAQTMDHLEDMYLSALNMFFLCALCGFARD